MRNILWFKDLGMQHTAVVGGKNASLGEMISELKDVGINVPNGFATTSYAFNQFLDYNGLEKDIDNLLAKVDVENIMMLSKISRQIQKLIVHAKLSDELEQEIEQAYNELTESYGNNIAVAVRSSSTAEDLPEASFAGQQDTLLNIRGITNLKDAIKLVFASLYNDRAISYRVNQNFKHKDISISVGIQVMVRTDIGSSGIMFTIDTESGFDKVILINSSYGLGECIVQGMVNPDEFYVYKDSVKNNKSAILKKTLGSKLVKMVYGKGVEDITKSTITVNVDNHLRKQFSLSNEQIEQLARCAIIIEEHYGCPMDIEWGIDGINNDIYILQARPETVLHHNKNQQIEYCVDEDADNKKILVEGRAVGEKVVTGVVKIINQLNDRQSVNFGDIIVTDMTDPDWEPIMRRAAAIVTNRGGRTCHAAIVARELGIPAVVGCENATDILKTGMAVTVSCCEGEVGYIYEGNLEISSKKIIFNEMPEIPVKIMLNVGNTDTVFKASRTPNCGVGLARLEFIINKHIGIHPRAITDFKHLPNVLKETVKDKIAGYSTPREFYIEKLKEGISLIAATFFPNPVIVRLSDFKSNEYSNLIGGKLYEPVEDNPMMGFRGASRYISDSFNKCFELECIAINKVRYEMGLNNIIVMVPFVRTIKEAEKVIETLAQNDLVRGKNGLKIYMMCEIPANAILAEEFIQYFDGFSIGSNDLTQLILGIDRDLSGDVSAYFDERNMAVKSMIKLSIDACHKYNKYVGICGQGPSDHPEFAKWLIDNKIDSISLNPDTVVKTWNYLATHK